MAKYMQLLQTYGSITIAVKILQCCNQHSNVFSFRATLEGTFPKCQAITTRAHLLILIQWSHYPPKYTWIMCFSYSNVFPFLTYNTLVLTPIDGPEKRDAVSFQNTMTIKWSATATIYTMPSSNNVQATSFMLVAKNYPVCIHQMNRVNFRNDYVMMTAP